MPDYVTSTALKKTLELTGETFADDDINLAITAASAVVDSFCGRRFIVVDGDTDPETRRFPITRNLIEIDDAREVTAVSVESFDASETYALDDREWKLGPDEANRSESVPFETVRFRWDAAHMPERDAEAVLVVEGVWGWNEVPPAVVEATSILAARLLKRVREAPFGVAGMGPDGMAVRVSRSDPDVAMLLSPYTRTTRLS